MNGLTIVDTDILIDAALQVNDAVNCLADIERRSALAIDQAFITKNQRDYRFIDGLRLLPYPDLAKREAEEKGIEIP